MNSYRPKPVVLIVLDGFGHNESSDHNAIAAANTPTWSELWNTCPHTSIDCAGESVGLPGDRMGNSEVGHRHLGAGRLINQDFTAVNKAIRDGLFYKNPVLTAAAEQARNTGKALHIFGLLSPGGVHGHDFQIQAMAELAVRKGVEKVYMHAFLDGRDTPPRSAAGSIRALEAKFAELGAGRIATLCGRFYAMDRDNRWERVEKAYHLLVEGQGEFTAASALAGLDAAYARGEADEFVQTTSIVPPGQAAVHLEDGDVVVFMNFRADRTREITKAINDADFTGFHRNVVRRLGAYVTLTEYHQDFPYPIAFPPTVITHSLGQVLAEQGLTRLRLAETENYAHVTFFFNGGKDESFPGESRILVPPPQVKTYDLQPEMSAPEVTDEWVKAIAGGAYDVTTRNYANGDRVGHAGIMAAAVKAVETLDASRQRVAAALDRVGGEMLITADHGNVEPMGAPETGVALTQHPTFPGAAAPPRPCRARAGGNLAGVAPASLDRLNIDKPAEMTGRPLLS